MNMQTNSGTETARADSLQQVVVTLPEWKRRKLHVIDQARRMYLNGYPRGLIAKQLNVSLSTVCRWTHMETELTQFVRPPNRPVVVATKMGHNGRGERPGPQDA